MKKVLFYSISLLSSFEYIFGIVSYLSFNIFYANPTKLFETKGRYKYILVYNFY